MYRELIKGFITADHYPIIIIIAIIDHDQTVINFFSSVQRKVKKCSKLEAAWHHWLIDYGCRSEFLCEQNLTQLTCGMLWSSHTVGRIMQSSEFEAQGYQSISFVSIGFEGVISEWVWRPGVAINLFCFNRNGWSVEWVWRRGVTISYVCRAQRLRIKKKSCLWLRNDHFSFYSVHLHRFRIRKLVLSASPVFKSLLRRPLATCRLRILFLQLLIILLLNRSIGLILRGQYNT